MSRLNEANVILAKEIIGRYPKARSATIPLLHLSQQQNGYVTYERSLAGTLGTFSIFYDLSERFTLRARTGEKSAIDLIFKISYE